MFYGGEQIADTAIVTFNDSASFTLNGQPETVQTVQSSSANTSILLGTGGILTVAPSSSVTYSNGGAGESDFGGSISGSGTGGEERHRHLRDVGCELADGLTVNAGILKVNGKQRQRAGDRQPRAAPLLGQGTIAGAVTVAAGGTVGAGFSAGLLDLGWRVGPERRRQRPHQSLGTRRLERRPHRCGGHGIRPDRAGWWHAGPERPSPLWTSALSVRPPRPTPANPSGSPCIVGPINLAERRFNPGPSNFGKVEEWQLRGGQLHDRRRRERQHCVNLHAERRASRDASAHHGITNAGPGHRDGALYQHACWHQLHVGLQDEPPYPTDWYPAGTKTATDTSDSRPTVPPPTANAYYRVYYMTP